MENESPKDHIFKKNSEMTEAEIELRRSRQRENNQKHKEKVRAGKAAMIEEAQKRIEATELSVAHMMTKTKADAIFSQVLTPFVPNSKQEKFARILISTPTSLDYNFICKQINVNQKTIHNWYTDHGFRLWIEELRRLIFMYDKILIDKKLIEKAKEGSFKHMELFYQLVGDLKTTLVRETREDVEIDSMTVHEQYSSFQREIASITGRLGPEKKPPTEETKAEDVTESKPDDQAGE